MFDPKPVTLAGPHARLTPLAAEHAPGLLALGADADIWTWLPSRPAESPAAMERWIAEALAARDAGTEVPFAILDADGALAGSTRYLAIERAHRRLEIGWTWLGPAHRRTAVNTQCKMLLLSHAFDDLGAVRVEFKTDHLNTRSREAILRLGATQEGVFRKHRQRPDGTWRDSVWFSILDTEWPRVRERLQARLTRGA
ncbi:MAG: GNAT family protein [Candidatus Sumerlaeia bacterium]|nr:GNAT family protein [Candidatus Sumerlaeia bacterium]